MKPVLRLMLGLAVVVTLAACGRPPEPPPPPAPPSASDAAKQFFQGYRGDYRQADQAFLSRALAAALQ